MESKEARPARTRGDESPEESPPPIDQTDRNEVLSIVREVFADGVSRTRDEAIRDIAAALGYRRVGPKIAETLSNDVRTAVRRGILTNEGNQFALLCRTIDGYTLDHLVDMLIAAIGPGWQTRDAAVTAAARHLGYRRTGTKIQTAFKSALNAAIRRSLLERDGATLIRKVR